MELKVRQFIQKHHLLTKGATIIVGVSGGPDSMALLHCFYVMREDWDLRIIALTVDHQLRGEESLADLTYVKQICEQWQIEFISTSVNVPAWKQKNKQGTQMAARTLRYAAFQEQMEKLEANYLALGHHGDDQIETMVMRLIRAADSQSFKGIPAKRAFAGGYIVRPLLCVSKDEIWNYCQTNHISPRLDASNEESVYTRNYVRHHILPLLKEKNNSLHTTVQHLSETITDDQTYLLAEAKKMVASVVCFEPEKRQLSFEIRTFKTYAFALQRRAYHLILNYLYVDVPNDLSYVHEEQFFAFIQHQIGNAQIDFPAGLKVEKSYDQIRCYFHDDLNDSSSFHKLVVIPGKTILPDGSVIHAEFVDTLYEQTKYSLSFSADQVALPLHIRTRKNGDRMRVAGLNGRKKVKDIFIDAKVPRHQRAVWPIVTDNDGEILWLVGLRKAALARPRINTSQIQLYFEKGNK
ncbi:MULTISPECIES: tRNA lysidine(34) synthetase TilS [Clostridia]|uniref:tRNA lysidine(34) synthetase TilS n=1 Tax=Clostridia TaxID=186801 RepID=UPI000EA097D6|nr:MULTISPECIES: tRNA lysidine(34) synthetase TilS [Clostridia]NBJ71263.1 tRNA lysidine(34) synthetase TilS [Roseburia sp. 1XD42-34]RKI74890.1 tRNA lysidine(34) synthetase TilS [Clostridium sp. 1xD42-85]